MSTRHRATRRLGVACIAFVVILQIGSIAVGKTKSISPAGFIFDEAVEIGEPGEGDPPPRPIARAEPRRRGVVTRLLVQLSSLVGFGIERRASHSYSRFRPSTNRPVSLPRSFAVPFAYKTRTMDGSVVVSLGCRFGIVDENENHWDFTYEVRLYDPQDQQILFHQDWAADKPGLNATKVSNFTDPPMGTYRCTVQWWVNESALPLRQTTQTLTYLIPTGESSTAVGWNSTYPTAHEYNATLVGPNSANFAGRWVYEGNGGGCCDSCYWPGSVIPEQTAMPMPPYGYARWLVNSNNTYGIDAIGWLPDAIQYYRDNQRAPCSVDSSQIMHIERPGTYPQEYQTNQLKMGFSYNTAWAIRDGVYRVRDW